MHKPMLPFLQITGVTLELYNHSLNESNIGGRVQFPLMVVSR